MTVLLLFDVFGVLAARPVDSWVSHQKLNPHPLHQKGKVRSMSLAFDSSGEFI